MGSQTVDIRSLTPTISPISDLGLFVSRIANAALFLAAVILFLYLVWGGIQWLTAGDDKGKVEEARTRLTNALIGMAIVATSWAIFLFIDYFLGLNVATGAGGSGGGGGGSGGGGGGSGITGNPRCTCGTGGCATTGVVAPLSLGGACYRCTDTGWMPTSEACGPITCGACP